MNKDTKQRICEWCESTYKTTYETMKDLQPIAFLITATIVIAGIFSNSTMQFYRISAILASLCFIFTYFAHFTFKITNYHLFFIIGIITGFIGFFYILTASGGFNLLNNYISENVSNNMTVLVPKTNSLTNKVVLNFIPFLYVVSFLKYYLDKHINHGILSKILKGSLYEEVYKYNITLVTLIVILIDTTIAIFKLDPSTLNLSVVLINIFHNWYLISLKILIIVIIIDVTITLKNILMS